MMVKLTVNLRAGSYFDAEAKVHVGWCPSIDIYSQGTSATEAREALNDAILMYLQECYRRKILDNILQRQGFSLAVDSHTLGGAPDEDEEFISVVPTEEYDLFSLEFPLDLVRSGAQTAVGDEAWPS